MNIIQLKSNLLDSNVYIVENNNHCLIVDCGAEVQKVKNMIKNLKVDGILLTHGHFDHSAYCNEYAKSFDSKIYASEKAKDTMQDKDANYSKDKSIIDDFSQFIFLNSDCKLQIGVFEVECIIAEGHSPCCVCFKIEDCFFAGDVLFENGIGSISLINSNKEKMIESLEKLSTLPFKTCYSGHGEDTDFKTQQQNIHIFKKFLSRKRVL